MKTVIAYAGQTLLDIALQEAGTVEAVFELAAQNGLSVTDDLVAGGTLSADLITVDLAVLNYFKTKGIRPASAPRPAGGVIPGGSGIGSWAIGVDFIVS